MPSLAVPSPHETASVSIRDLFRWASRLQTEAFSAYFINSYCPIGTSSPSALLHHRHFFTIGTSSPSALSSEIQSVEVPVLKKTSEEKNTKPLAETA